METLARTAQLTPAAPEAAAAPAAGPGARRPMTTVGELCRAGALVLMTGNATSGAGLAALPVLTEHDGLAKTGPSGVFPLRPVRRRHGIRRFRFEEALRLAGWLGEQLLVPPLTAPSRRAEEAGRPADPAADLCNPGSP